MKFRLGIIVLLLCLRNSQARFKNSIDSLSFEKVSVPTVGRLGGLPTTDKQTKIAEKFAAYNYCSSLQWLLPRQQKICIHQQNIIPIMKSGAELGIRECKQQYKHHRWNCSLQEATDIFSKNPMKVDCAESAFLHSITSAAITYIIAKSCGTDELTDCGCDKNPSKHDKELSGSNQMLLMENFEWKGCSDNIKYGEYMAEEFMSATKEITLTKQTLMNKHNEEVGRQVIKKNLQTICRCHGLSGSCTSKICWRAMPYISNIGSILKTKAESSIHMKYSKRGRRLKPKTKKLEKPTKRDLVHLENSPTWCEVDRRKGSAGTHGRLCNKTSSGVGGCELLCCGRGYDTLVTQVVEKCNCKFVWCCEVKCDECIRQEEETRCN